MKIKSVDRNQIKFTRVSKSKYRELYTFLDQLKPEGKAVEVEYFSPKELNSIRNLVYNYNKTQKVRIKSSSDPQNNRIYFYLGSI
jgi:hypothetical protein